MVKLLEVTNLKKTYGSHLVWDNVNFTINEGEIVGFVGNNGSGKSTLINAILGLTSVDTGKITYHNTTKYLNSTKLKREIGFLLEIPVFDYLDAPSNLRLCGLYEGISLSKKEIDSLLKDVQLSVPSKKKVSGFSFGMQQRLRLAMALLQHRKLLLLDEPTVGLDPNGIELFNKMIVDFAHKYGVAILISSHQLHDINQIVDRYILLKDKTMVEKSHIFTNSTYIVLDPNNWSEEKTKHLMNKFDISFPEKNRILVNSEEILADVLNSISEESGVIVKIIQDESYSKGVYE